MLGLLREIVLLPLAPVRGVAWTLGHAVDTARQQQAQEIRRELIDLEAALRAGEIDDHEFDVREDELLDRLDDVDTGQPHRT